MESTPFHALQRALAITGGTQAALAAAIGLRQSSISEGYARVSKGGSVPVKWVLPIENATNGQVTRQQLRPDLWPDEAERAA